jgi:NAD(P)-dependent dehydrogenase (short-subunit alcohol dehydrogenase family)
MKHVVITGSTRGIGYGLANAFLDLGCSVTISGREKSDVDKVVEKLAADYSPQHILGLACDVREVNQVQELWDKSKGRFQKNDIWINNAGYSGPQLRTWEIPPDKVKAVIETNLLGVIIGSQVAIQGMLEQGFGGIYNMEGMGSDGRKIEGLTIYGTSKYGLRYFTDSLVEEMERTPIVIGALHPGMVITELITDQYEGRPEEWERDKRIFNILADRVETVSPWMAEQILKNDKSGVRISWLSRWKLMGRFLASPFSKRDLFADSN